MITVDLEGTIKEILFEGDKSCIFMIDEQKDERKELKCVITKNHIKDLSIMVTVGEHKRFIGNINAYRKVNKKGTFIENVFYVDKIKDIEKESVENVKN